MHTLYFSFIPFFFFPLNALNLVIDLWETDAAHQSDSVFKNINT